MQRNFTEKCQHIRGISCSVFIG